MKILDFRFLLLACGIASLGARFEIAHNPNREEIALIKKSGPLSKTLVDVENTKVVNKFFTIQLETFENEKNSPIATKKGCMRVVKQDLRNYLYFLRDFIKFSSDCGCCLSDFAHLNFVVNCADIKDDHVAMGKTLKNLRKLFRIDYVEGSDVSIFCTKEWQHINKIMKAHGKVDLIDYLQSLSKRVDRNFG